MQSNMTIKNAFVGANHQGAPASVELFEYMTNEEMLAITKKLNLPISCFVKPTGNKNEFYIRYFIKDYEEPICGHGTLVATKFLADLGLLSGEEIVYIPMMTPTKPIKAEISGEFISIFITTVEPRNISLTSKIGQDIIAALPTVSGKKTFDAVNIVEGNLDYTVEITKYDVSMTSEEVIKSIEPRFEAIEKIALSSSKLCRGVDVVIKNDEKTTADQPDFITRIFLPLGADPQYKEDPACGSGTSYVIRYLIQKYPKLEGKELNIYQASKAGAFIKAQSCSGGVVKVSGMVK